VVIVIVVVRLISFVVVVVVGMHMSKRVVKCPYCGYEWVPRVEKPKKCPRCQRWLPPWKPLRK